MEDLKAKDFALFQIKRKFTNISKNFLFLLEDLQAKGDITEETFSRNRKRVLDYSNDAYREIEENFKNLTIKITL